MTKLLDVLNKLCEAKIHYTIQHNSHDAVMVLVAVPGERWEIEFLRDGSVEVEVFTSSGVVSADSDLIKIENLIANQRS